VLVKVVHSTDLYWSGILQSTILLPKFRSYNLVSAPRMDNFFLGGGNSVWAYTWDAVTSVNLNISMVR